MLSRGTIDSNGSDEHRGQSLVGPPTQPETPQPSYIVRNYDNNRDPKRARNGSVDFIRPMSTSNPTYQRYDRAVDPVPHQTVIRRNCKTYQSVITNVSNNQNQPKVEAHENKRIISLTGTARRSHTGPQVLSITNVPNVPDERDASPLIKSRVQTQTANVYKQIHVTQSGKNVISIHKNEEKPNYATNNVDYNRMAANGAIKIAQQPHHIVVRSAGLNQMKGASPNTTNPNIQISHKMYDNGVPGAILAQNRIAMSATKMSKVKTVTVQNASNPEYFNAKKLSTYDDRQMNVMQSPKVSRVNMTSNIPGMKISQAPIISIAQTSVKNNFVDNSITNVTNINMTTNVRHYSAPMTIQSQNVRYTNAQYVKSTAPKPHVKYTNQNVSNVTNLSTMSYSSPIPNRNYYVSNAEYDDEKHVRYVSAQLTPVRTVASYENNNVPPGIASALFSGDMACKKEESDVKYNEYSYYHTELPIAVVLSLVRFDHNYHKPMPDSPPMSPLIPDTAEKFPDPATNALMTVDRVKNLMQIQPTPLDDMSRDQKPFYTSAYSQGTKFMEKPCHADDEDRDDERKRERKISESEETETAPEGEEESVTRCICEMEHDDGYMICCDKCFVWQHVDCMFVDRSAIPDEYLCERCEPRRVDTGRARMIQLQKCRDMFARIPQPSIALAQAAANRRDGYNSETSTATSPDLSRGKLLNERKRTKKIVRKRARKPDAAGGRMIQKKGANNYIMKRTDIMKGAGDKKQKRRQEKKAVRRKPKARTASVRVNRTRSQDNPSDNSDYDDDKDKPTSADSSFESPRADTPKLATHANHLYENYEEAVTNHYSPELRSRILKQYNSTMSAANAFDFKVNLFALARASGNTIKCKASVNAHGHRVLMSTMFLAPGTPAIELRGKFMLGNPCAAEGVSNLPINRYTALPKPGAFIFSYRLMREGVDICVDARTYGNDARFVRRSCNPNCEIQHCVEKGTCHLYVVTLIPIEKHCELTIKHDVVNVNGDAFSPTHCACDLGSQCTAPRTLAPPPVPVELPSPKPLTSPMTREPIKRRPTEFQSDMKLNSPPLAKKRPRRLTVCADKLNASKEMLPSRNLTLPLKANNMINKMPALPQIDTPVVKRDLTKKLLSPPQSLRSPPAVAVVKKLEKSDTPIKSCDVPPKLDNDEKVDEKIDNVDETKKKDAPNVDVKKEERKEELFRPERIEKCDDAIKRDDDDLSSPKEVKERKRCVSTSSTSSVTHANDIDKKKMTREERKMEAILRAIERQEKQEQRQKSKKKTPSKDANRSAETTKSDQMLSPLNSPTAKACDKKLMKRKKRKRRSLRSRTGSMSGKKDAEPSDSSTDDDYERDDERRTYGRKKPLLKDTISSRLAELTGEDPVARDTYTRDFVADKSDDANLLLALSGGLNVPMSPRSEVTTPVNTNAYPEFSSPDEKLSSSCLLVAAAIEAVQPGFKFPKTKKAIKNYDTGKCLTFDDDRGLRLIASPPDYEYRYDKHDEDAGGHASSSSFLEREYVERHSEPIAATATTGFNNRNAFNEEPSGGNAGYSRSCSMDGSAKKRWLRLAMEGSDETEATSQNEQPQLPAPLEMIAPPKKRRMARVVDELTDLRSPPLTPTRSFTNNPPNIDESDVELTPTNSISDFDVTKKYEENFPGNVDPVPETTPTTPTDATPMDDTPRDVTPTEAIMNVCKELFAEESINRDEEKDKVEVNMESLETETSDKSSLTNMANLTIVREPRVDPRLDASKFLNDALINEPSTEHTPTKKKLSISEYRKRKQITSPKSKKRANEPQTDTWNVETPPNRTRTNSASSLASFSDEDAKTEADLRAIVVPDLTKQGISILSPFNSAPTLAEQQRENLTARLKREFGLLVTDDANKLPHLPSKDPLNQEEPPKKMESCESSETDDRTATILDASENVEENKQQIDKVVEEPIKSKLSTCEYEPDVKSSFKMSLPTHLSDLTDNLLSISRPARPLMTVNPSEPFKVDELKLEDTSSSSSIAIESNCTNLENENRVKNEYDATKADDKAFVPPFNNPLYPNKAKRRINPTGKFTEQLGVYKKVGDVK